MTESSLLQQLRTQYKPSLPKLLQKLTAMQVQPCKKNTPASNPEIDSLFPHISKNVPLSIEAGAATAGQELRIGVVLSGGQAPGGHNVISGLFDALHNLNPKSKLYGFLNGPSGIVDNQWIEITQALLAPYRNQGGFDLIGSGRTKIEKPEQLAAAEATMRNHNLDGLIIVGGDDSNTNAALLAERFIANGCKTRVIGVPKTIDGDLKSDAIEISFGFDTACKVYSEIIGNLMRDAISAKKYYFFVKLMGRSASHIALECALQTHPNITLIGEEVAAKNQTVKEIVADICDVIAVRADQEMNYGVILIPEGIVEFIPEVNALISELNTLLTDDKPHAKAIEECELRKDKLGYALKLLTAPSQKCFQNLPEDIQAQLLLGRDSHGNVQVAKIETERMLIEMVKKELKNRAKAGEYKGSFSPQPYFCGYEGRSCLPSNFDSQYCYALGHTAALLINAGATGYICSIKNLTKPVEEWIPAGFPLTAMMTVEKRHGSLKPVIQKALVDLTDKPFLLFSHKRSSWSISDQYVCPGPMQFFGPQELTDSISITLTLEHC